MGKENERGELKRGTEDESTGIEKRGKGSITEGKRKGQEKEKERREEEQTVEEAIEEMLTECYEKAFEKEEMASDYDLGGGSGGRKRPLDTPGQGRETATASQADVRSKQLAGLGRRQRQSLAEEKLKTGTGEVWISSQTACERLPRRDPLPGRGELLFSGQPIPRLALTPCRGDEALTEHGATSRGSWH